MSTQTLTLDQLPADLAAQAAGLSAPSRTAMLRVVGRAMANICRLRLLNGKGPEKKPLVSWAAETKFAGKFSAAYKVRPSGARVTASSRRLIDTRRLANSYGIPPSGGLTSEQVTVGPQTGREVVARNEAEHDNEIVGWDNDAYKIVEAEISAWLQAIAEGRSLGTIRQLVASSNVGRVLG
jgi:hypothetical protein